MTEKREKPVYKSRTNQSFGIGELDVKLTVGSSQCLLTGRVYDDTNSIRHVRMNLPIFDLNRDHPEIFKTLKQDGWIVRA